MDAVTVGVDIGTTSVKALAVDGDGRILDRARIHHGARVPSPDRLEHDVDIAWRKGVTEAYGRVAAGRPVAAVQVAAMVPSMTAVDAAGHALTPGLLYGDVRGATVEAGTAPSDSGELLAFVEWCARAAPEATGFWPAQAVANHALTGRAAIDTMLGLMAMPLFDGTGWDSDVCARVGVRPDQLPAVIPGSEPVGDIDGVTVGAGTIDAYAEQLCAGLEAVGDVLVICGTTLITWLVVPEWIDVPGLWTVPSVGPGEAMVGGASNAGGLFLEWAKRLGGQGPAHEPGVVASELQAATDPERVPVWTPYVRGERTPLHDPSRRAALHDLDLTHGPAELRRAAYEAAGFVVRRQLELAGRPARRIVATGGGVRDREWMQALADATGLPVDVVAVPEGAAYGAAFQARVVAGLEENDAAAVRWARTDARVEPRPDWCGPALERYQQFCYRTEIG